jgi:FixJ family two-component response regulator
MEETIFIVDDDEAVRTALDGLLRSVGHAVQQFPSTQAFQALLSLELSGCLILDVRLPGVGGLDFQQTMNDAEISLPIIFITGYGDIPMCVRAMKAGAVDFLSKPFRDQDLLDAVQIALEKDRARRLTSEIQAELRAKYATLSTRERQVTMQVVEGKLNKQIAADLGLREITIKVYRGHAMRKMRATSLADLVRMVETIRPKDERAHPGF